MSESQSRRTFLSNSGRAAGLGLASKALGLSAAGFLASCSGSSSQTGKDDTTIQALFSPDRVLVAGVPLRIPFAIFSPSRASDSSASSLADVDPVKVSAMFNGELVTETEVTPRVVEHIHHDEFESADSSHQHQDLRRYYPLRTQFDEPGIYDLNIQLGSDFNSKQGTLVVQIFDPKESPVLQPGAAFPIVETPTVANHLVAKQVDQLCTREEQCSFHEHSAKDLLEKGEPFVLLVATPALCQTPYCGPVLETLIANEKNLGGAKAIHVEVYANADEVKGNFADPKIKTAPAVDALGLAFEPSLFLVDNKGKVADRIDNVFDTTELEDALAALSQLS